MHLMLYFEAFVRTNVLGLYCCKPNTSILYIAIRPKNQMPSIKQLISYHQVERYNALKEFKIARFEAFWENNKTIFTTT